MLFGFCCKWWLLRENMALSFSENLQLCYILYSENHRVFMFILNILWFVWLIEFHFVLIYLVLFPDLKETCDVLGTHPVLTALPRLTMNSWHPVPTSQVLEFQESFTLPCSVLNLTYSVNFLLQYGLGKVLLLKDRKSAKFKCFQIKKMYFANWSYLTKLIHWVLIW